MVAPAVLQFALHMIPNLILRQLLILALCWLGCSLSASAQITIFNVPSADVAEKKSLFVEHESQFRPHQPGPFEFITQYTCLGIGFNTELDLTLINLAVPKSNNMSLGLGFKTAIPILKRKLPKRDLKLTFGELVP